MSSIKIRPLLSVNNLRVKVDNKTIINGLDFKLYKGKIAVLLGANGSGKSSLAQTIVGNPQYKIISGHIKFDTKIINHLAPDKRATWGIFLAFQNPVSIPGLNIRQYLYLLHKKLPSQVESDSKDFDEKLKSLVKLIGFREDLLDRDLNDNLSGGEKKRLELLQLFLLRPKLVILDEIDSGLDLVGLKSVGKIINELAMAGTSVLLITHYTKLLDYITIDRVMIIKSGQIIKTGQRKLLTKLIK